MTNPKALTRKELSRFLPDQRSIRAFEQLFELIPSELEIISGEAADSTARGNQNTGMAIEALTELRSAKVLLWLSI